MVQFRDLPVELLSPILSYVLKPNHLSNVCRVSRDFYDAAIPKLYLKVTVFAWHKDVKTRASVLGAERQHIVQPQAKVALVQQVVQLFATLASCPHLARHVHTLEIRDFAKNLVLSSDDRAQRVFDDVLQGLKNCVNLHRCAWTRDGSLTSEILQALLCASANVEADAEIRDIPLEYFHKEELTMRLENRGLRELEVNGHDGFYNRVLLLGFVGLERISLIMPSAAVVALLPTWTSLNHKTLRSLTLICKSTSVVTDEILMTLAPILDQLEELHLTGCPKITHNGVLAILATNTRGILTLGLEGVSSLFDMAEFSRRCTTMGAMRNLRSITLTLYQHSQSLEPWFDDVIALLAPAPLEVFQMYSVNTFVAAPVTNRFWDALAMAHGSMLKKFAVHRMMIGLDAIRDICERCMKLEQLFIVVAPAVMRSLGTLLSCARNLRTIHINHPLEESDKLESMVMGTDLMSIVDKCSPTLAQLGCNTRVWQISNSVHIDENGDIYVKRVLSAYDSPDIPEAFLVVRT